MRIRPHFNEYTNIIMVDIVINNVFLYNNKHPQAIHLIGREI